MINFEGTDWNFMQSNAIQWSYMFGRAQKRNGCWWQSNGGEVKNDGVLWGVIWAAWEQCIERNHCRTRTSQSYPHQRRWSKVIEMSALLNNALEGGRGDFWNGWEKITAIIDFNSYATNTPVLQNNEKVIQGSHCGDPLDHHWSSLILWAKFTALAVMMLQSPIVCWWQTW